VKVAASIVHGRRNVGSERFAFMDTI
jgi:hypothetical protein